MPFELVEIIPAGKRGKNADIKRILDKEGELMLAAAGKNRIVTLDIPGENPGIRHQLAHELERWKQDERDVSLLIGGPEGVIPACKAAAGAKLVPLRADASPPARSGTGGRKPVSRVEHYYQPPLSPRVMTDQGRLSSG